MRAKGKGKGVCFVVADGAKARLFLQRDGEAGQHPELIDSLEGDRRPSREIGTDRPGRTFESADVARHGYAPRVDWHTFEKHLFARRVVDLIEDAAGRHEFDRVVLVAPPKALGELRAALPEALRRRVKTTLGKDLTGLSEHELTARLAMLAGERSRKS